MKSNLSPLIASMAIAAIGTPTGRTGYSEPEMQDLFGYGVSVSKDGERIPPEDFFNADYSEIEKRVMHDPLLLDLMQPGYVPMFEAPYDSFSWRAPSPVRSGGQQKSRDVAAGRAAEKRARKARAITRRSRK